MLSALHSRILLVLIAPLTLTACGSLGFLGGKTDMPNTGVKASTTDEVVEYVQIFKPDSVGSESTSSLLMLALDRLAGWAFGALRDAAVARLDKLAGEFSGGFEAEYSENKILQEAGLMEWRAVRGVRFAVKQSPEGTVDWETTLERVGLSASLKPYFESLMKGKAEQIKDISEYQRCALGNLWWLEGGLTIWVQFETMELRWRTEVSEVPQSQVFRVRDPKLTVWASEARMLNWPRHKSAAVQQIQELIKRHQRQLELLSLASKSPEADPELSDSLQDLKQKIVDAEDALGRIRASNATKPNANSGLWGLLGSLFLKEHGMHVAVRLNFSGILERRSAELGEVAWAFDGIWPMDTATGDDNVLLPAYSQQIKGYASRWIPMAPYQTVQIAVRESSDVEAWIKAARDQVAELEWDEITGQEERGRQRPVERIADGVVRSSLTPIDAR